MSANSLKCTRTWGSKPKNINKIRLKIIKIIKTILIFVILTIFITYFYRKNKEERIILKKYGIEVKGIVEKRIIRKRGVDLKYIYQVNEKKYESWTNVNDNNIKVGDSIDIIYYEKDPRINRYKKKLANE